MIGIGVGEVRSVHPSFYNGITNPFAQDVTVVVVVEVTAQEVCSENLLGMLEI
jgi:hypothetical protein